MVHSVKNQRWKFGISISILLGALLSVAAAVVFAGVIAGLVINQTVPVDTATYLAPIVLFICTLLGSFLAGRTSGNEVIISGAGAAAGFLFVLIAMNILVFDSGFDNAFLGIISILAGCGLAILLLIRKPRKKYRVKRK